MYNRYLVLGAFLFLFIIGLAYCSNNEGEEVYEEFYEGYDSSFARASEEGVEIPYKSDGHTVSIPVAINNYKCYMLFDTGASMSTLSEQDFLYLLRQRKIKFDKDEVSKTFSIADGSTVKAYKVWADEVVLGEEIHLSNVEFYVMKGARTSLLGQNIIKQFHSAYIDRNNEVLRIIE